MASRRRRAWATLTLVGAPIGLAWGAVMQSVRGLLAGDRWSWAELAVAVVAWMVVWPLTQIGVRNAQERGWFPRNPGTFRSLPVKEALRVGCLPPGAVVPVWRRALTLEARQLDGSRWVLVGILAVDITLVGCAAVVANDGDGWVWAVAVVLAAAGGLAWTWIGRELDTVRRLLASVSVIP